MNQLRYKTLNQTKYYEDPAESARDEFEMNPFDKRKGDIIKVYKYRETPYSFKREWLGHECLGVGHLYVIHKLLNGQIVLTETL